MQYLLKSGVRRWPPRALCVLVCIFCTIPVLVAQTADNERPVPILTGNAGYFTISDNGTTELVSEVNPVLLLPLGDRWLIESRAEFYGQFDSARGQSYGGKVYKERVMLRGGFPLSSGASLTVRYGFAI